MSVIYALEYKLAEKRVKELIGFLTELDEVCDSLYDMINYDGIFDILMYLEEVRIQYYMELFEHQEFLKKGKI